MKKLILKTIFAAAMVFSLHTIASAQVSLSINIGRQPAWGPSGYNHVDYYYLPDIESYYDVTTGQYIYQDGGRWIFANALPPRYRGYDLYSGYKVVVNRPKPYLSFARDRSNYGHYKNWSGARQPMLRESRNVNGNINRGSMNHGNNRPGGNLNHPNNNPGENAGRGNMNHGGQQNHQNQMGKRPQAGSQPQGNQGGGHDDHGHH